MAVNYLGKVGVYGVNGLLAFTGMLVGDNALMDGAMTDSFDTFKFKDGEGKTRGVAAVNRRYDATFTIVPYGVTIAAARALVVMPGMLGAVTITGFSDTEPPTGNNKIEELRGRWTYVGGGTVTVTQGDFLKITLPCRRYGGTPDAPTLPPQT